MKGTVPDRGLMWTRSKIDKAHELGWIQSLNIFLLAVFKFFPPAALLAPEFVCFLNFNFYSFGFAV